MKTTLIQLLVLFLFSCTACKKHKQPNPDNPYGLPNATQTGANVFACRVNGQNWISKSGSLYIRGGLQNSELAVSGFYEQTMGINLNNFSHSYLSYQLSDTINSYGLYQVNNSCLLNPSGGFGGVTLVKSTNGLLTLTNVDTIKKILSGTFWFNIKTDYCDTLKITDGRFDIKYY